MWKTFAGDRTVLNCTAHHTTSGCQKRNATRNVGQATQGCSVCTASDLGRKYWRSGDDDKAGSCTIASRQRPGPLRSVNVVNLNYTLRTENQYNKEQNEYAPIYTKILFLLFLFSSFHHMWNMRNFPKNYASKAVRICFRFPAKYSPSIRQAQTFHLFF